MSNINTYTKKDPISGDAALGITELGATRLLNLGTAAVKNHGTATTEISLNSDLRTVVTVTGNATVDSPSFNGLSIVNVDTGAATITIPSGVEIGGRITVRKISSSPGTVTIARSSTDVFTRASLTSVTLTSNGDFWILEKVTSTRWELVDGVESGSNSYGAYYKYSDGTVSGYVDDDPGTFDISTATGSVYYSANFTATLPLTIISGSGSSSYGFRISGSGIFISVYTIEITTTELTYRVTNAVSATERTEDFRFNFTGRWYT